MIKWGIIGLGNMGNNFAEATKEINDVTLNAIASQNDSKLQSFKKKFNIPNESCFANYDQLTVSSKTNDNIFELQKKIIEIL